MDTEFDYIEEMWNDKLGLNDDNFLAWLPYNAGVRINFLDDVRPAVKREVVLALRELYWDDFVSDMEMGYDAEKSDSWDYREAQGGN